MKVNIEALTRVEGEGGLEVRLKDGRVEELKLRIYEPPRFIEGILRGKPYHVIPDITSRICGICPVAYQMSGVLAIEDAFGVQVPEDIERIRRLMYCGEWIQSHALHVFFLHLPDFYRVPSVIELSKMDRELVLAGMDIKRAGSLIIQLLGGRTSHPVSLQAGGFSGLPETLEGLKEDLEEALEKSLWASKRLKPLNFPSFELELPYLSLVEEEYPVMGRELHFEGKTIRAEEFKEHFMETEVAYSNAKHGLTRKGKAYLVGPLARFNNAYEKLSPMALDLARELGLEPPMNNPYKSLLVRMVEVVHALERAINLVENYTKPERTKVDFLPREGEGYGATEAPRGVLWHHYRFSPEGKITYADIVPPTSQNQRAMELSLIRFIESLDELTERKILEGAEPMIRNFDPCISCATHFLKVKVHV
ncbi:MAG: Ni/Fe hydrogenase subunit alpha [Acidobacteria bacterium]|nr:MAG: Ni/Fe hydrogenase subunit alpha [Acidobacteriota bacterium]